MRALGSEYHRGVTVLAYCRPYSVRPGDEVAIHVSAPGGTATIEIVRDGAATGCTDWVHGLGDPAVERLTRNVLDRLGRDRVAGATP
ncbi:MAG: hypothetical protein E6J72_18170 [Deltaproteobacteria bacterium]|nr:MAG: hypothetical protein E6J72_18170 [Deltaproteobacteria bacterium]